MTESLSLLNAVTVWKSPEFYCEHKLLDAEVAWKMGAQLCAPLVRWAARLWDVKRRGKIDFEVDVGLSSIRQYWKRAGIQQVFCSITVL